MVTLGGTMHLCVTCGADILLATFEKNEGRCMPCLKGTRYAHVAYLGIEEFFSRATHDYCLAPNLEPHAPKAEFSRELLSLQALPGVARCIIPVIEFEQPAKELDPYSDRMFVVGEIDETVVEEWAAKLGAEHYREERAGAELPRDWSSGQVAWCLVWD